MWQLIRCSHDQSNTAMHQPQNVEHFMLFLLLFCLPCVCGVRLASCVSRPKQVGASSCRAVTQAHALKQSISVRLQGWGPAVACVDVNMLSSLKAHMRFQAGPCRIPVSCQLCQDSSSLQESSSIFQLLLPPRRRAPALGSLSMIQQAAHETQAAVSSDALGAVSPAD